MDIFKEIPHEFVPAEDLSKLVNDKSKVFWLINIPA